MIISSKPLSNDSSVKYCIIAVGAVLSVGIVGAFVAIMVVFVFRSDNEDGSENSSDRSFSDPSLFDCNATVNPTAEIRESLQCKINADSTKEMTLVKYPGVSDGSYKSIAGKLIKIYSLLFNSAAVNATTENDFCTGDNNPFIMMCSSNRTAQCLLAWDRKDLIYSKLDSIQEVHILYQPGYITIESNHTMSIGWDENLLDVSFREAEPRMQKSLLGDLIGQAGSYSPCIEQVET